MVAYNNKKYYIDIIESKPANAISIIETDCEVDFAPPLDYKEPERVTPPPVPVPPPSSSQGKIKNLNDAHLTIVPLLSRVFLVEVYKDIMKVSMWSGLYFKFF